MSKCEIITCLNKGGFYMATQTQNLKLTKPNKTDFYNVDDFNGNMDIIDEEIQNLKPKVIVVGETEAEWKRAIIVAPDLQFTYYAGSQYASKNTSADIILDNVISDNIQKAVVVSIMAQQTTYQGPSTKIYDIGCGYCARIPDGKYHIDLHDKEITEHDFTAYTVVEILYK